MIKRFLISVTLTALSALGFWSTALLKTNSGRIIMEVVEIVCLPYNCLLWIWRRRFNFSLNNEVPNIPLVKLRCIKHFCIVATFIVFFGLCPILTAAVQAKDNEENYHVYTLGEVIVTADQIVKESPTTISEVTAADIEKYNASNLGDALKLLPGIYFRQGRAKQESYASIRGFEQDKVLILLDGMPIYQPYEGLVNLTDIPVQNIAKIKVIKGVSSSLYGPNSMGGVINIITRKGGRKPEAALSYEVSEYNTNHIAITHGQKVGNLSYFMGISHKESDGFRLANDFTLAQEILASMAIAPSPIPHTPLKTDSGLRENTDYSRDAITFTASWDVTGKNILGISMEYYNNEYGIAPGAIYRETRRAGGTAYWYPRYWRFDDCKRYTVNITDEYELINTLRFKARFFYDDYKSALNAYDDDTYSSQLRTAGAPSFDSEYDDYNIGGNFYVLWDQIHNHHVRLGYSFKKDVHRSEYAFASSVPEYEKLLSHTYSVALEDIVDITDSLSLTVGASYDTFEQIDREQTSGTTKGDDIHSFNPQAGISYIYSDALNFYASIGRKIRFPTMRNLYANGVIGPKGDPNMKEEKTIIYEFGSQWWINENLQFEGSLFYNDVEDLILFNNQIGRFEQYADASLYGMELNLSARFTTNLTADFSYTYLMAENDGSTVVVESEYFASNLIYKPNEIPYRPRHKFNFDLTQSFDWGLEISLNGSLVTDQIFYDHADPADNTHFVAVKRSLDGFFLLNTKITYDFNDHYQIFGAVENILNEEYQELYLFPASGIRAWVGVKLTL
jgi:outer membrane receptor protein involved in Fe transport